MTAIGTLDLHRRERDDVLQESLLDARRDLIKLIEIDEQHLRHLLQHLFLVVHLKIAYIAEAQFWRQQLFAEGGLVPALRRDEQRHCLIAVFGKVRYLPLAHHAEEPGIEPVFPIGILRGYRSGELADMIFSIPLVILRPEIITYRIIGAYHVRLHIAAHIVVVCIDTCQAHFHRHAFQRAVIHRRPVHILIFIVLIFRISHNRIVTEQVARIEEVHELVSLTAHRLRFVISSLDGAAYLYLRFHRTDVQRLSTYW